MTYKPKYYISINITNRCNLNCAYCIAYSPYNLIFDDISLNKIRMLVKLINMYLSDSFRINVVLVGGEPLLYPSINDIIIILREIYKIYRINICTNGCIYIGDCIEYDILKLYANLDLINWSMSYHVDTLIEKNSVVYHQNFKRNIKLFNDIGMDYHIKIIQDGNTINNKKREAISEIVKLNKKEITYPTITGTKFFHIETNENIINNVHFDKNVYPYRGINITRNILNKNHIDYIFSYLCHVDNLAQYKSVYSFKNWKNLKEKANTIIHCTKPLCSCNMCEEV